MARRLTPDDPYPRCPYQNKIAYPSPQVAWRIAFKLNRTQHLRRLIGGVRKRARVQPKCRHCHCWHITSTPKKEEF